MKRQKAFTLIELLVVISVIGLLATIILVGLNLAKERAKNARAQVELNQILKAIEAKRLEKDGILSTVTGSWCSGYPCRTPDLSTITQETISSSACIQSMTAAFQKLGVTGLVRDP